MDHRDDFILRIVAGKSFVEVGGLWGEVNEKLTVAHLAGARSLSAIDIWEPDSEWWARYRARAARFGIAQTREIIGSIDNPSVVAQAGRHDVVHCAGVLYHCPNPFLTLEHLRAITSERLLLTVAVMPNLIENKFGTLRIDDDAAVLVPAIDPMKRKIVDEYIVKRYGGGAYGVNAPIDTWYFSNGRPNYGPWWWLWTAEYVRRMIEAAGFVVQNSASQFDGTGHLYECLRVDSAADDYGRY